MKDIRVSIGATNVKSVKYDNQYSAKPGEPLKMTVKTNYGIRLNPSAPTTAVVAVKYEAFDEEKKSITFEMETLTPVTVSTFVDNLDELIKKNYLNDVMIGVFEKIRSVTQLLGLNIQMPVANLPFREDSGNGDGDFFGNI